MDIRTRLSLALVSLTLLGMLAIGAFAYETASALLREVSERQLDALAESKQRDLEKVARAWHDRVQLIRSRTRLRTLVGRLATADDPSRAAFLREIERILGDALRSVQNLERVTLFDASGERLLVVGASPLPIRLDPAVLSTDGPSEGTGQGTGQGAGQGEGQGDGVRYAGTAVLDDGRTVVRYLASLTLGDRVVGALETVLDGEDLRSVTESYTGLGDSGESLVFMGDGEGGVLVLAPLRHEPERRLLELDRLPHVAAALAGQERLFRSGVRDYRGEEVWVATRALPELGWGLAVKIDREEERRRAVWLRDQLIDLGLSLGAIAILVGTLLGFWLGRPLRALKDVVERVRAGETDLRADASGRDEVGFLAGALNELLEERQRK